MFIPRELFSFKFGLSDGRGRCGPLGFQLSSTQLISFHFLIIIPKPTCSLSYKMSEPLKAKYNKGHYCCIEKCNSRQGREDYSFHKLLRKNQEQTSLWIKAVGRLNWTPSQNDLICGKHFVGGKPSRTRTSPDYVPSLHLKGMKPKTQQDLSRHERVSSEISACF